MFHKNTILLKYEFLKREVSHRFGRRSPELERVKDWSNELVDVKLGYAGIYICNEIRCLLFHASTIMG